MTHPSSRSPRILALAAATALAACGAPASEGTDEPATEPAMNELAISSAPYGTLPDGRAVTAFTLTNGSMEVVVIDYGAIITELHVPDREGTPGDVVLGFDSLEGYLGESPYFGAIVGRYGNRIAAGHFTLDGVEHQLATNDGPNHLHGGEVGFDKVLWSAEPFELETADESGPAVGVRLTYVSEDGEEGYPGTLTTEVTYLLGEPDTLVVDYTLATDAPTVANVTQHSYFNLAGTGDVLAHELRLAAAHYTPVDDTLIPTGEIAPVADTPFDFTTAKPLGRDIGVENGQLAIGGGYDHNFVLDRDPQADAGSPLVMLAAEVYEPTSGRTLDVLTTEPGVQLYSGNFLDGTLTGKGGVVYTHRSGFCLETQHYPDSPNQPDFPSTVIRPGEPYFSRTVFRFGTR